jgi:hypothetical protein
MNIRTATISDFDGILTIEKQIFELHYNARPDIIDKIKYLLILNILKNVLKMKIIIYLSQKKTIQ